MPPQEPSKPATYPVVEFKKLLKTRTFLISTGVILIAIVASVIMLAGKPAKKATEPFKHTYSATGDSFDSFTFQGQEIGGNLTFSKPSEITSFSGEINHQIVFTHFLPSHPITPAVDLDIVSISPQTTIDQSSKDSLGKMLTDHSNSGYASQTKYFHDFVNQRLSSNYSVSFGATAKFTNPTIKNNAWVATYTATAKPGQSATSYPTMKGQEILMVGDKTYYFFLLDAVDYNWTANQATWQKVLNSIQIDQ